MNATCALHGNFICALCDQMRLADGSAVSNCIVHMHLSPCTLICSVFAACLVCIASVLMTHVVVVHTCVLMICSCLEKQLASFKRALACVTPSLVRFFILPISTKVEILNTLCQSSDWQLLECERC